MKLYQDTATSRHYFPLNSMVFSLSPTLKNKAECLLVNSGLLKQDEAERALHTLSCDQLHGDGSNRRFFRIYHQAESVCVLVIPAGDDKKDIAESRSAWLIGSHLRAHSVPLPEIYGWDEETGILLFEDLGDVRLHDLVASKKKDSLQTGEGVLQLYCQVLKELAHMQCRGAVDFDESWCWDGPRYDQHLMLERESGYFLRAFWQGLLGKPIVKGVYEELEDIAKKASRARTEYFLHRDFQCRNIMLKDGRVRFIDFQGGRMGPLGYDLASLLIDPYAGLSATLQDELLDCYIADIGKYLIIEKNRFIDHYNLLAFQRNMQIVGAFSYLYKVQNKGFFADYILPALSSLAGRLQQPQFTEYPITRNMVKQGIELLSG
jgi:aminoglycoside/choline kinase family phosphotransferase